MFTIWFYIMLVIVGVWILLIICWALGGLAPCDETEDERLEAFAKWDKKQRWKRYKEEVYNDRRSL